MNNLKTIRIKKGYTLEQLANITNLSKGYICHLEKGSRNNPSFNVISKLATALSSKPSELFFD